jgi:S-adenosylmethionine hydrolase
LITLTTDFGSIDPFVGQMKGVILRIHPDAVIVDLTHGIRPQGIREAAIALGDSAGYFPPGTVHVAVVDPGVGSGRRRLALEAGGHLFVGPDNGVFTSVITASPRVRAHHVVAEQLFLESPGRTFDGRDVFAPVAAHLDKGLPLTEVGPEVTDYVLLPLPRPLREGGRIRGEVIHVDAFGNAITNVTAEDLASLGEEQNVRVLAGGAETPLAEYYAQTEGRGPGALINSAGRLEVFLFGARAAEALGLRVGDEVLVVAGEG